MANLLQELCCRVLPLVSPGRALADSEWRTVVRMAEVVLEGCEVPLSAEEVADNVEQLIITGNSRRAWRIRALCTLVEWLPFTEHGKPFSQLSVEQRHELLADRFQRGRLGRLCYKLRFLVVMGAYGDAKAEPVVGYQAVPDRARFRDRFRTRATKHRKSGT